MCALIRGQLRGLPHAWELEQVSGSKAYLNQAPDLAAAVGSALPALGSFWSSVLQNTT